MDDNKRDINERFQNDVYIQICIHLNWLKTRCQSQCAQLELTGAGKTYSQAGKKVQEVARAAPI